MFFHLFLVISICAWFSFMYVPKSWIRRSRDTQMLEHNAKLKQQRSARPSLSQHLVFNFCQWYGSNRYTMWSQYAVSRSPVMLHISLCIYWHGFLPLIIPSPFYIGLSIACDSSKSFRIFSLRLILKFTVTWLGVGLSLLFSFCMFFQSEVILFYFLGL